MTNLTDFFNLIPDLIGIFMLMLSTFLIGYFSAWSFQNVKYKRLVSRLKKEVNDSIVNRNLNNMDTVFTEIKPKIEETGSNNLMNTLNESSSRRTTAEKVRTSYVSYNVSKPELDFDSFGYPDKNNKDNLTLIKGVGPYIELKLNEIGIYNYDQIGRLKENDIRIITTLIDFFPGRIDRDDWVGQARQLQEN